MPFLDSMDQQTNGCEDQRLARARKKIDFHSNERRQHFYPASLRVDQICCLWQVCNPRNLAPANSCSDETPWQLYDNARYHAIAYDHVHQVTVHKMAAASLAKNYQRMSVESCFNWKRQRHVGEEVESVDVGPLGPSMSFLLPPVSEVSH